MFKKFMFVLLILITSGFFTRPGFSAESYQYIVSSLYDYTKSDTEKTAFYGLGAAMYFEEVSLENTPYEYAAFYHKVGYFGIRGLFGDYKYEDGSEKGDFDLKTFSPVLNIVIPGMPVFLELNYIYMSMDGDLMGYDFKRTLNGMGIDLGFFLMDGFAASISYERDKEIMDKFWIFPEEETIINTYGFGAKYVTMLNDQMGLHLAGFYTRENSKTEDEDAEVNSTYSLEGDFYFTPKIGLGAEIDINRGDDKYNAGNNYTGRFSIFITSNIKLALEYSIFKVEDADTGEDSSDIAIELTGRF